MLERYCKHHNINNVNEVIVRIDGIDEPYIFHLIAKKEHLHKVLQISEKVQM